MDKSSRVVIGILSFLVALLALAVICLLSGYRHGYDQERIHSRDEVMINEPPSVEGDHVLCPADARLCPDGKTYVSRTGSDCAFATCPTEREVLDPIVLPQQPGMDQRALDENLLNADQKVPVDKMQLKEEGYTSKNPQGDDNFFEKEDYLFYLGDNSHRPSRLNEVVISKNEEVFVVESLTEDGVYYLYVTQPDNDSLTGFPFEIKNSQSYIFDLQKESLHISKENAFNEYINWSTLLLDSKNERLLVFRCSMPHGGCKVPVSVLSYDGDVMESMLHQDQYNKGDYFVSVDHESKILSISEQLNIDQERTVRQFDILNDKFLSIDSE